MIVLIICNDFFYRGIYLTPYSAKNKALLKKIKELGEKGLLNAVVVDMKDDRGKIRFYTRNKIALSTGAVSVIFDVKELIDSLKVHGIKKVIARIVCFKDDYASQWGNFGIRDKYTKELWEDYKKISWLNPYNKKVWDYILSIIKEVEELGFDEIQLDYVRFPTDGDISRCLFYGVWGKREEAITAFVRYIRKNTKLPLSVDVFGYATWRVLVGEGQNIENMGKYVDYVCPMLYPSHFSPYDFAEYGEPVRSYLLYYESIIRARKRLKNTGAKVVAYIQGFNYKTPFFTPDYIFYQILGALDAGSKGFFIWNAAGNYDIAFSSLLWAHRVVKRKLSQWFREPHGTEIPRLLRELGFLPYNIPLPFQN